MLLSRYRDLDQVSLAGATSQTCVFSRWAQLVRCVYDPAGQQRITEELVGILLKSYDIASSHSSIAASEESRQDLIAYFNTTFLRVAPALKDRHFSEEKEWRMVTVPQKITDPKFRAFVSNSRVSEYYVYEFAPDQNGSYNFLPSMMLGPTQDRELIGSALGVLCMRQNVRVKHIRYSQIPYRG